MLGRAFLQRDSDVRLRESIDLGLQQKFDIKHPLNIVVQVVSREGHCEHKLILPLYLSRDRERIHPHIHSIE